METIERTDAKDQTTEGSEQRSRWLTIVIVLMAIALVGLIAWMTLAMRPNSSTAAPPEIVELLEDYTAAFNSYDADALEAVVTDNYRLHSELMDYDLEGVQGYMFELGSLASMAWTVTNDGPYYVVEGSTGTWYVSSEGAVINREGEDYPQNSLWEVVDARDGGLLVAEHFFMGG